MSVFLRWGIFGILGVAALLYAYNASKRMAEHHVQQPVVVPVTQPAASAANTDVPERDPMMAPPTAERPPPVTANCAAELAVARQAIEARRNGEPLDRLLRMQEIAFEESPVRRARLEKVATRYFNYEGEFRPDALRIAVISDCQQASP
jgi:hypothetical protein